MFKLGAGSRKMVWRKLGMTEAEQQMVYEEMKQEAIEKLQLAALAASAAPHGKKKA